MDLYDQAVIAADDYMAFVDREEARATGWESRSALQLPFPVTTPPVKMGYRNVRRRFCTPKYKIILPLKMPRVKRRAFQIID